ncbi:MAG TPA: MFS transporter [Candidatus Sulfotelmatobacter sp.]|nr:MFS transporter [Candidatus Sulfotelmatobacter sp.]
MSVTGAADFAAGADRPGREFEVSESDPRYYGWRVVLAASLGVMGGFGSLFVYTFSVFVKPLSAEFGWSREAISAGFAVAAVTLGAVSPLLGRWMDRFGPRRIILICVTVFSAGMASLSLLRGPVWQLYATCFVLGLVGNGAAHLSYSRAISGWFQKRLGLALALVMVGAGLGAMILPVLAESVIGGFGWRAAYGALGGLALLLGLPLSWRYVRDGAARVRRRRPAPSVEPAGSGMSWQEGMRSGTFWIIVATLFIGSIAMNGAITHMVALLTDRRITAGDAALCASLLGGASVLGRVAAGWLLDRFFGSRVAFVLTLLSAGGVFLLARASHFSEGALAAGLIGIGVGGEAAITPYLLSRYFGLRAFATLYGVTWTFYAVAGATGPILLGRSFDLTGSYSSLLELLAVLMVGAGGLYLLLRAYPEHHVAVERE